MYFSQHFYWLLLHGPYRKPRAAHLLGDLTVGVIGSLLGSFVFGLLGLGAYGLLGRLVIAIAGAVILLWLIRFIKKA